MHTYHWLLLSHAICLQIDGRKSSQVSICYNGQSLRPSSALLLLVTTGIRATSGKTLSYTLNGVVAGAKPQVHVHIDFTYGRMYTTCTLRTHKMIVSNLNILCVINIHIHLEYH